MFIFLDWLIHRDAAALLRLLEAADYFDPQSYNPVFEGELEKLLSRIPDSEARRQAAEMKSFDWGAYISRSLQRADEVQEHFHQIVIRLIVKPGTLFGGWNPQQHGPLASRFRNSVWNAIRNVAEKTRHRRQWMQSVDPVAMADRYAGREPYSSLLDEFRQLVSDKLGRLGLAILDQRLRGEETKDLVSRAEFGTPSAYIIKREISEIKKLAERFAAQSGDPAFANMLAKALAAEAETVARRKAAVAARQPA
jgi:hypothetical protein